MASSTALLLTAAPTLLSTMLSALSVAALAGSATVLLASIRNAPFRHIATVRIAFTLLSGALLATSLLDWLPAWALALSCLGLLTGLQAIAIDFANPDSLRAQLSRPRTGKDPGWWPEFEQQFWHGVERPAGADDPRREPPDPTHSERS
jgi:hypothetical protein